MTQEQYIQKLERIKKELDTSQLFGEAIINTHYAIVDRIFEKGQQADGKKIGKYISPQYRKKRLTRGRQVSYVDFTFEGGLKLDFATSLTKNGDIWESGVNADNFKLVGYLNERYGDKTFKISEKEKNKLSREIKTIIINLFK